MKYSIQSLFDRPAGTVVLLPVIPYSVGFERSYLALLRKLILQEAARGIRELIAPAYNQQLKLVHDADGNAFSAFRILLNSMVSRAATQLHSLLALEGKRHTKSWLAAAKRAFSIDLRAVVKEEDLEGFLETVALRNAALIQGLSDDLLKQIQYETTQAILGGQSYEQLQKKLRERLGVADSRARLIARDQMSKLNASLDQKRQEEAGVDEYIWRTSEDERVRARHRNCNGKTYKWGEKTDAEDGLPPGQPIQCRCTAQGIVRWK